MFIDLGNYDLIKGITRTEAKKVHKDLPDGGAWRTIKGHHVYIKDGKILAGSIPGVTKAKKMTKATMAEHQAALDAEGKTKDAKSKSKAPKKASGGSGKKSGANTGGKSGTKKAKDSGSGTQASAIKASKGKADETTKPVGAKTNGKAKSSKPASQSSGTRKPVQAGGAEKKASEGQPQNVPAAEALSPSEDTHYEAFHGTALPKLENIRKNGFKPNGGHSDFGNAAYFKSPAFDAFDTKDHRNWVDERKAKGQPVPERYDTGEEAKGNDTKKVVDFFTDRKNPVVLKAFIPKEHVLDCSKGRPKELDALVKDHAKHEDEGTSEAMMGFALKHILGMDTKGKNEDELYQLFHDNKKALDKAWGRELKPFKVSPYEVYAKKTGVKAIVDKLDAFKDEGWQIGVYDPKIIQIKEHGKGLQYNEQTNRTELIKALQKAGILPYCLLHHHIDEDGLHLHVGVQGSDEMEKSLTRKDAKAVHKELPAGGEWRTIKGHHIYIKDGKVLAGSIPGVTKAKKATKAQLAEHQATLDAEKKPKKAGKKTDAKKTSEKPQKADAGKKRSTAAKPSPAKPKSVPKPESPAKKQAGKKAAPKAASKEAAPKVTKPKDIRTDAQKNRSLAYDVGDKVGGARKDEFIASFKEKPTAKSLEELEKMSGAIAEKMVTKANLLPKFDFVSEHESGVDLPTAILKKLIQDRIAPKPDPSTPETRKAYMMAMSKVQRHFGGIKSFENMRDALRELSVMARQVKAGEEAESAIARYAANPERWSYFNSDSYKERAAKGKEAAKFMDFNALGDKFNNLLTNYESLNRSIDTVRKNTKDGWEKYLTPQAKAAPKKEKGAENKKWEREAVAEHLRKGGKETKVKKPEDLMKEFNLRGVEFGNWVNDSSGLFHLKRSAEAFEDLSDIIGVDKKDISLNGRLAIAFGARGKGGALAHYEPDRKVINMTKYGGAGSLAHEWGHAMDNILHQYSNGGQESLGLASQGQMGNSDPKLKALYDNLMDAITKPAPGESGGTIQMLLDSSTKQLTRYYPEMRRQINSDMKPEDVYHHWASKINEQYDRYIASAKNSPYNRTDADKEKAVKKYEQKRSRELKDIGHYMAHELRLKQNGGKYGGDHYKGHIEIPTGKSEYMTRMEENQPGKTQNGVHYWSAPEEMFARVFESYVQDTMKKAKRENNYLVHGTSEGAVKAMGAPFPIGKERQHMFKAMKNLLDYVGKKGTLKKALMLEILASGAGNLTEELRKSMSYEQRLINHYKKVYDDTRNKEEAFNYTVEDFDIADTEEREHFFRVLNEMGEDLPGELLKSLGYTKRSAYNVANPDDCLYIPINRLRTVYQTEKATNWDKVEENKKRMEAGENLDPVSIGLDYDVHDGHHRIEAAKACGHEHIPCVVKGGNELEQKRAVEAYREVWKAIETDPTDPHDFGQNVMFRGIGARELKAINASGVIQSKGKGNDEDKGVQTCFSNLYSQAEGYARSNYDLYHEHHAFVLVVRKPEWITEDEHGELVANRPVPVEDIVDCIYVPKEDIMKSFDESKHKRDEKGRFTIRGGEGLYEYEFSQKLADPAYDAVAKATTNGGSRKYDWKSNIVENLYKVTQGADLSSWFEHHAGQALNEDTPAHMNWHKDNLNHIYKKAKHIAEHAIDPKEKQMYEDVARYLANATIEAKKKKVESDERRKRNEFNDKAAEAAGMDDNGMFINPFHFHDKHVLEANGMGLRNVEMAQYLDKLTEKGKKGFTIESKNVKLTFHPSKYEESKHGDKSLPGKLNFKVDIKTKNAEIKGATFMLTRSEKTKSKRGHRLPKHAQYDLDQYTLLFDFPKVKKKIKVYGFEGDKFMNDASPNLKDYEDWGYKHLDTSTKETIQKTGLLVMRMITAHSKQNGFEGKGTHRNSESGI